MDTILSMGMLCISAILAFWCYEKGRKETDKQIRQHQRLFVIFGVLVAFASLLCLLGNATYAVYGYLVIGFVIAYVALCMWVQKDEKQLPFYLALSLIGIYVLGTKMHERYLLSGIVLLLVSYLTTKDKRVLYLAVGFSITTFINTAIVLDNSILYGAAQGHLNDDTLAVNGVLSVINVALCAYALFVGKGGLKESPVIQKAEDSTQSRPKVYQDMLKNPCDARLSLRLKDYLIMGVVTVLYAIVCFTNLGSTVAPQDGWISTSSEEEIIFELDESQVFAFLYYGGVNNTSFYIAISDDGENWSDNYSMNMTQGLCYRWNYGLKTTVVDGTVTYASDGVNNIQWFEGKYIRLQVKTAGLSLWEIVAVDTEGNVLPISLTEHNNANEEMLTEAKPASNLINEQDTYVGAPSWYNGMYFDEIYHARTAYEHLHGQAPYETTHPPLGKLMMSASIAIFGMTPFGWRFAGALIGVLMLPAMYLLGIQLFKRRDLASVAMIAMSLDLMHFTQTRIATIDSFPVFFIILSYLCMVRYLQWDVFSLKANESPRLWTSSYRKSHIPLALSGLFMGLSIASKWVGLYSAVGLALLYFIAIYRQYRASVYAFDEPESGRMTNAQRHTIHRIAITCGLCVVFFVIVPAIIYYVSYIPYLSPTGEVTIKRIISAQEGMLNYHSTPGLGEDHPFNSPWWQWPFILKPMWFAMDSYEPTGFASTILCMGNPWIFYIAAFAMLTVLGAFMVKRSKTSLGRNVENIDSRSVLLVLSIGFLAQYLPWVLVPRGMYIYHYFASVPFIILATTWCIGLIPREKKRLHDAVIVLYLLGALVFFVMFFPYASGMLTSTSWLDAMKWFPNLYY